MEAPAAHFPFRHSARRNVLGASAHVQQVGAQSDAEVQDSPVPLVPTSSSGLEGQTPLTCSEAPRLDEPGRVHARKSAATLSHCPPEVTRPSASQLSGAFVMQRTTPVSQKDNVPWRRCGSSRMWLHSRSFPCTEAPAVLGTASPPSPPKTYSVPGSLSTPPSWSRRPHHPR